LADKIVHLFTHLLHNIHPLSPWLLHHLLNKLFCNLIIMTSSRGWLLGCCDTFQKVVNDLLNDLLRLCNLCFDILLSMFKQRVELVVVVTLCLLAFLRLQVRCFKKMVNNCQMLFYLRFSWQAVERANGLGLLVVKA
jgi:hypothetical protein